MRSNSGHARVQLCGANAAIGTSAVDLNINNAPLGSMQTSARISATRPSCNSTRWIMCHQRRCLDHLKVAQAESAEIFSWRRQKLTGLIVDSIRTQF